MSHVHDTTEVKDIYDCGCECHEEEPFGTPTRWQCITGPTDVHYLCTDCLLTRMTEQVGQWFSLVRLR
jgi:hypothetical protein